MSLTHIDEKGRASMVDISGKDDSVRVAQAVAHVRMRPETLSLIMKGDLPKGEVLPVARLAGIMAAKRTSDLIPLCHPIRISRVAVDFAAVSEEVLEIVTEVAAVDSTGVEMEALTAAACAALTVIDMCKAVDKGLSIEKVHVLKKSGGRSGDYVWQEGKAQCKEE
ncbi:MAG TPA: cyclic pyranopterin monophosphate synthase MoaC [Bacillota bacterium]|nr:cyclic pyranopterin monophosphate synthase MoaC [Bacillota bacterium]